MQLDLWTSAFCAPCAAARRVSAEVSGLVPDLRLTERDVANHPDQAEDLGIRSTPTLIVRRDDGAEVFRSPGVPSRDQLLLAIAKAV